MYEQQDLSTDILLKWSKLLEYDFFRLYSSTSYCMPLFLRLRKKNRNRVRQNYQGSGRTSIPKK
jgi:hypothetical protein